MELLFIALFRYIKQLRAKQLAKVAELAAGKIALPLTAK